MNTKTVAVIGLGYIGLPTAVALAGAGHRILGVDTNPGHVQAVNAGQVPFLEPGLGEALQKVHAAGLITASEQAAPADVYIVSVPTPFQGDHHADLSFVMAAADEISPYVSKGALVILESTSPPGTTEAMSERIEHNRPDLAGSLLFAHCPERVLPGKIMVEMFTNDRIVGGLTPEAAQAAQELYASFCRGQIRLTDAKTAELSKLAENSFRDVNIAFANELAKICDYLGIDVWELIDLANLHPRVNILRPGPGVGGHCIAVDPWFIVDVAPSLARLIHTAREVNDSRPDDVVAQAQTLIHEVRAKNAGQPTKIAVLGLAFKPDVDDLRSSPAITVADKLAGLDKVELLVCEPNTATLPPILTGRSNIRKVELAEGLQDADLVVGLVAHRQFRALSRDSLTVPVLDACGIWR
ncbi:UDP-N-acetyl-D-mannosamine dehydrogenase [Mobiluncus mulieris]|uniref:UDP-N-acetyl-D-mannosamine dehydrogenase n=1 Tax=Mobiluncus mulieris TaxID=2052 RepID=A0ABD4TXE9_9ACTO|nr:UDP-N-acetyl-D-mannosamine dehydrogenase [Mobiluncus mulieris]MCU9968677.1 UDP-N-acetyl-D-mannosamine dehydrogenase [Mobiluncus mulieris]MCU9973163.1 UDP-N-acetyl-D-mannosamine dehydrogenase [Mobiluncus mulieris]NMX19502.1 UDP-N-acetyl-D-mannosamine dehydrogenase [Mobiluncus mulieris]